MASWLECDHFWKISAGSLSPRVATKAVTAEMMHGVNPVVSQHYIRLEQVWVLAVALGLADARLMAAGLSDGRSNSKRRSRAL